MSLAVAPRVVGDLRPRRLAIMCEVAGGDSGRLLVAAAVSASSALGTTPPTARPERPAVWRNRGAVASAIRPEFISLLGPLLALGLQTGLNRTVCGSQWRMEIAQ